ncbi:hypothetical protein EJB05_36435, partial [Eragrostis curvula]
MEALLRPAQHEGLHVPFGPKPYGPGDGRFSSPNLLTDGADLFYGYSSHPFGRGLVPPSSPSPRATSRSRSSSTPSPRTASGSRSSSDTGSVVDDGDDALAAAEHSALLSRLALQYQETAGRYRLCFSHLADTSDEAVALRQENDQLRVANGDLMNRIVMVGGKHSSAIALADDFRRLNLAEEQARAMARAMPPPPSPPAVMRPVPAVLPKSISVRSSGYLKMNPSGKHRVSKTTDAGSQRVFVGMDGSAKGEEKKDAKKEQGGAGLEFEVYNQGMFKTELCNQWEETGACSYGDHCQFAHGITELRPVIRHPRYKTEVCRMMLAGILCPYGHRCHFRHSITPSDGHLLHRSSPTVSITMSLSKVKQNGDKNKQRVFVGMDGAAKEEGKKGAKEEQGAGGLDFEVYTQGMFKTELCNKWEATGACSYGDLCQFAHGIAQLRPVIRHPRYKTKVCRTVLTGILCPYGHRCHFRHSITPADGHLLRP